MRVVVVLVIATGVLVGAGVVAVVIPEAGTTALIGVVTGVGIGATVVIGTKLFELRRLRIRLKSPVRVVAV